MKPQKLNFNYIVETLYNLTLEEKLAIKILLENNIVDTRRNEIVNNFRQSQEEFKSEKLKFSSTIDEAQKTLVTERFEEIRKNPERLLDWEEAKKSLRTK